MIGITLQDNSGVLGKYFMIFVMRLEFPTQNKIGIYLIYGSISQETVIIGGRLKISYSCLRGPQSLTVDNAGRLHCENDAALYYSDGYGLYMWHGVTVPKWVIETPEKITIEKIEAEQNSEVRRVMMIKYGMDRYFEESGAEEVHRDRDTKGERILYRKKDSMGIVQLIKLENSTPEQDGSKKYYTFRVNPDVKTCHEAVASLYSMNPKNYAARVES